MASMMTSGHDGIIRAISEQEWNERRRKELFPEELFPSETPMTKDLAIEVLRSMFSVELIRKYLCDQTLLIALQSQELLSKSEMETVLYIHQTNNKVLQLIKILCNKCRDRALLERFYCALHDVFEYKSNTCRITSSYRPIFETFKHTVWRASGVPQQSIEKYESSLQSVPALCERLKQHCRLNGEGRCLRDLAAKLKLRNIPPDVGAEWICEKVVEKYPEPREGFNVLAEALLLTRGLGVVACGTLPITYSNHPCVWKCINDRLTKPQWQKVLEHFGISNPKASPISARDVVQCLQIPNIGEGVSKCLQEVCGQSIRHSPMSIGREDSSCLEPPNVYSNPKSKRKGAKRKQHRGDNTDPMMDAVKKDVQSAPLNVIDHLKPELNVLRDVRCKWFDLGLELDIDEPTLQSIYRDKVDTQQYEDSPVLDQHEGDTTSTTQTDKNLGEFRQVVSSDESITRNQTSTFNIATSVPSSRSTLYTNNLRAYSERETLHEQGVGNNETPLNEFNEPLPTEHAPANVLGQRSNALMHDHSDEDTPGGQSERQNQTLFGQPLTVPLHSTYQAPDKSYGHPLEQADTGDQSTANQPEQSTFQQLFKDCQSTASQSDREMSTVSFGRPLQPSNTFDQELDCHTNANPLSPSSEAVLATASAKTFGQPLTDKDHGGDVHSNYRASMERLPPVTQTLPNPSSHSEHAQFSTQTSVYTTTPAVSQVTRTVANDFNIATSGTSTRSTLYTNNLRAYSERETLHEQGVGNNETRIRADVSSNLPSDDYSDDEPPLRARLDPNEEQLSLAQEDDGDRYLFKPRLRTLPPERPPSPTTSGRPFHSLQGPESLQDTGMEVLHEFAQICISAASKTRGQEKLMEIASSSGHDHLTSFFIGYFFNVAEFCRGGKLVTEFIGGSPSPLNFLISKSLATKASFEAVLSEMGKQDFPDQLLLALHQFPGSDHLPSSGQAMVKALFSQTFVIGSIDTSNSQQDPSDRLRELMRNLNDRSPTPPPPKPYSGPPQETKYEFPAEGGHRLGTQGDDTQKNGTVPPSKNDVASNASPATCSESKRPSFNIHCF